MTASAAARNVAAVFAELAGTLAADLDTTKYLTAVCRDCVDLTDAASAAIRYAAEPGGAASAVVASDDLGRRLASEQDEVPGPWAVCMATGQLFTIANLRAGDERWPRLGSAAAAAGITAATFVPLSPSSRVTGALGLLGGNGLDRSHFQIAVALADAAAAGILLAAEVHRQQATVTQLRSALSSRIIIEQAKGVLAERWHVAPDAAFAELRRHARRTQRRLADLALEVVQGRADTSFGPHRRL